MLNTLGKKRKVSKKTKRSWRKFVDTKDVDNYLDDVRLEERLGAPFATRKDEELFIIDKSKDDNILIKSNKLTKQEYRELLKKSEPRCFASLKPCTAVPDPIVKRNRVKTKEERKSTILKQIESKRKLSGKLKLKERVAIQNKLLTERNKANQSKRGEFNVDIWQEKSVEPELKNEWLSDNTKIHVLANTGRKQKRIPKSLHKKPSVLPVIVAPHPGTSYNPSYADHQELLSHVAADEIKLIKEDEHLDRVTRKMFRKLTPKQKQAEELKEMSEGLPNFQGDKDASSDEDSDPNLKPAVNQPAKNTKKTLSTRRKQREQQKLRQQHLKEKVEKRKVADIYHLKSLTKEISYKQRREESLREKRLKVKAKRELKTKTLSKNKFEPIEQEFQMGEELSGSLRRAQPVGNLLKERYKSLQQRNMVAPGSLVLKRSKAKTKRFVKPDHKINAKITKK